MDDLLHVMIDQFLANHRHSNGGWAEITEEDIDGLRSIINALVSRKCDKDPDGDYPIEVKIINRRTTNRLSFYPLPYYWVANTTDYDMDLAERFALENIKIACDELQQVIEVKQYRKV
jgi:hypothetical protein